MNANDSVRPSIPQGERNRSALKATSYQMYT
jgi:hypothetical protein